MRIIDYLEAKYPDSPISISRDEAKVLGVPFPLKTGWLDRHGPAEILPEIAERLKVILRQSKRASAVRGLEVLRTEFCISYMK